MYWYGALLRNLQGYDVIRTDRAFTKSSIRKLGKGDRSYITVFGPYEDKYEVSKIIKRTGLPVLHRYSYPKSNPPKHVNTNGAIEIYDDILAIEAKKGKHSLWPSEYFRHDFTKRGSKVFGLRDGNLLVVGRKPLWKNFKYPKDVSNYG